MRLNMLGRMGRRMREDLVLAPVVGEERLGVAFARYASSYNDSVVVVTDYAPLPAGAYVEHTRAPVGFDVRWLMAQSERAGSMNAGLFLVHLHNHYGTPWFSPIDMRTNRAILLPIGLIDQTLPTGALLLSRDRAAALLVRAGRLGALDVAEVPG